MANSFAEHRRMAPWTVEMGRTETGRSESNSERVSSGLLSETASQAD
jgi:hypothetical protein